jgi:2-aminobenzoate-CoA ligase
MSVRTSHIDTFVNDGLPSAEDQAQYAFSLEALRFPETLNCAAELLDKQVHRGLGDKIAILGEGCSWTYQALFDKSNKIASVLTEDCGLLPGERVLLRAPNCPMLAASWLGVVKAGGIVVATMPLMRAQDLDPVIHKSRPRYALCDARLVDELVLLQGQTEFLSELLVFGDDARGDGHARLEARIAKKSGVYDPVDTNRDDVALIAFTSGTTGNPKGTLHYHSDVMSMCVCVGDELIGAGPDDIFIGSPPLAFTFGLGMLLAIPLHAGATTVLVEKVSPADLATAIETYQATICATAPTAYRAMVNQISDGSLDSLEKSISAGEHLPLATFEKWEEATGIRMIDGLGTTEMIHIFVSASGDDIRPGAIGKAINGYEVAVLDTDNEPVSSMEAGRLAVKGPTGCKYLNDDRQKEYVIDGWNITGDICKRDEDGYIWYVSRSDDMIISSGYNIAGPDVEAALLGHEAVLECAVVGAADPERGQLVRAYVVLRDGSEASHGLTQALQQHVKSTIAPYKYPRSIVFVESLPRTQTGKIQRFKLRQQDPQEGDGDRTFTPLDNQNH